MMHHSPRTFLQFSSPALLAQMHCCCRSESPSGGGGGSRHADQATHMQATYVQAQGEVHVLKQAIASTVAAAGSLWPPSSSGHGNGSGHGGTSSSGGGGGRSGYSSSGESDAATAVEQAARRLEALRGMLEARREQDQVSRALTCASRSSMQPAALAACNARRAALAGRVHQAASCSGCA